jgi:class 3 adenylate cyclase
MITNTQMPAEYRTVIDEQLAIYNQGRSIQVMSSLPSTGEIPIVNQRHWIRIPDVICVFVDMQGSTRLSATTHEKGTAGAYQLFTGTAVRLFDAFEAPYIDVRGDGVFALFNSDQVYRALAAAVTFKTFAAKVFKPRFKEDSGLDIGSHIGIDQKTVLVRKLGMKIHDGRSDRQNEVWAGKPVNMASKLASVGQDGDLLVSDRFFNRLIDDHALLSCGCQNNVPSNNRITLWKEIAVAELSDKSMFDFDNAHLLRSEWCSVHGQEYCWALLEYER